MIKLITIIIGICIRITSTFPFCQPPDVPYQGYYKPFMRKYTEGNRVTYHCLNGSTLSGRESRTCQSAGTWTGSTPFCDHPEKLINVTTTSDPLLEVKHLIDGDINTCYTFTGIEEQEVEIFFREPKAISGVRLFLHKGYRKLEIEILRQNGFSHLCSVLDLDIEENKWVKLSCQEDQKTVESIRIIDASHKPEKFAICEIEVYTQDDIWCKSPPQIFIPNGHLVVSRDKAELQCADGYEEGNDTVLNCINNTWSGTYLQCINEVNFCNSTTGNKKRDNWRFEGKFNTSIIGSTKKLHCKATEYITGAPNVITCQENGTWTFTTAKCKRKGKEINVAKSLGVIIGIAAFILFACVAFGFHYFKKLNFRGRNRFHLWIQRQLNIRRTRVFQT